MDLHKLAAAITFNIPYCLVTDEQRRSAKAANFGAAYTPGAEFSVTAEQLETALSRYEMDKWLGELGMVAPAAEPKRAIAERLVAVISRWFA